MPAESTTSGGKLLHTFKRLDILAPDIGLSVRGESGVKTWPGAILSLICVGLFIAASIYVTSDSLATTQPSVVQQTSSSSVYPSINMIEYQKFPALIFYVWPVGALSWDKVSRYVTVIARRLTRQYPDNDISKIDSKYQEVPLVPCSRLSPKALQKFGSPKTLLEKFAFEKHAVCPDLDSVNFDMTLEGKTADPKFSQVFFEFLPCIPANNPGGCASLQEISGFGLFLATNLMNLNLSHYEQPITREYNSDLEFVINPAVYQIADNKFKMVEVWNNNGMFTEETLVVREADHHTQRSQLKYRNAA